MNLICINVIIFFKLFEHNIEKLQIPIVMVTDIILPAGSVTIHVIRCFGLQALRVDNYCWACPKA